MGKSNKRDVIAEIFKKVTSKTGKSKVYFFDNNTVKKVSGDKFMNQFDATKFDSKEKLPEPVRTAGYFIVHLGQGKHAFVKGEGYHDFEKIANAKEWPASKSIIDNISDSEAQSASTAYNEGIIQDFLFNDQNHKVKIHTARRSKTSFSFTINGSKLNANKLQIEMDNILEAGNCVVVLEAKNVDHPDFEIRQLFNIHKYFENLRHEKRIPDDTELHILFLKRVKKETADIFKLYEYKFSQNDNPNSIGLVKNAQYKLVN